MKKTISENYIRKLIRESMIKQNCVGVLSEEVDGLYPSYDAIIAKAEADVLAHGYFGLGGEDKKNVKEYLSYYPITGELILTEDSLKQLNEIISLLMTGDPADEEKAAMIFPMFILTVGFLLVDFAWTGVKTMWWLFKTSFKLAWKAMGLVGGVGKKVLRFVAENAYEAWINYTTRRTLREAAKQSKKLKEPLTPVPGSTVIGGSLGTIPKPVPVVRGTANLFRYNSNSMKGKASTINDAIIKAGDKLVDAGFGGIDRIPVSRDVIGYLPGSAWYVSGIDNATGKLCVMMRQGGAGSGGTWQNFTLNDDAASAILNSQLMKSDPFVQIIKAAQ